MLEDYLVLDLTSDLAAYGTKLLADLGMRVIKVEPPGGDPGRRRPPLARTEAGLEESLDFAYLNTNKWSITLNLETALGRQIFGELAAQADVICETFERRELERLGIDFAELGCRNPRLVWVSVTPFGRSGPRRDWRGSDLIGWAASGLLFATGDPDRPPLLPGGPARLAYMLAGLNCAAAVLLTLRIRRLSGKGQAVDISLQEAALVPEVGVPAFLDDLLPRRRTGSRR
ncbi:MAG: CoA transferase, partial [Nitrososphaera sp.]